MGIYGLVLDKDKSVLKVMREANDRLKGGDGSNQALMFISGKISFTIDKDHKNKIFLICNIRPMFHIPFFKHIFRFSFKRALKKEGYKGRPPRFLMFSELSTLLEGII